MTNTCTRCEMEFNPQKAEFHCPTGQPHLLPVKIYYMDDAPADPGPYIMSPHGPVATGDNRKHSQTVLAGLIPEQMVIRDGQSHIKPGKNVTFVRGMYSTTNAEEQFYLDIRQRDGALCTKERWEQVYLTDYQRLELDKMNLAAREQRLEQSESKLLQQVKSGGKVKDQVPA